MLDIISAISWQEWLGVIFGILQVVLASRNNPVNYLFGIAGISLTLYIMFRSKLYAEFLLHIYYLVMSIYGWIHWKYGHRDQEQPVSYSDRKDWFIIAGIVLSGFTIFYVVLSRWTDSDVPLADALVSAFAWAGMWLMARRKIENWVLLNISNLISIPLFIHKDLALYALLSGFLFIVAIFGYFNWKKIIQLEQAQRTAA